MRLSSFRRAFFIFPIAALFWPPTPTTRAQTDSRILSVKADSTLKDRRNRYRASNLVDGKTRSWCEGVKGDGEGQTFTIHFNKTTRIRKLFIKNGFHHVNYWLANNRVRHIHVAGQKVRLRDVRGWQRVSLPRAIRAKSVRFRIDSVYPGVTFRDTCIEEISFREQSVPLPAGNADSSGFWQAANTYQKLLLRRDGKCIIKAMGPFGGDEKKTHYCLWRAKGRRILLHMNPPAPRDDGGKGKIRRIAFHANFGKDNGKPCLVPATDKECLLWNKIPARQWVETPFECDFSMGLEDFRDNDKSFLSLNGTDLHAAPAADSRIVARIPCGRIYFSEEKTKVIGKGEDSQYWKKISLEDGTPYRASTAGWTLEDTINQTWRSRKVLRRWSIAGKKIEVLGLRSKPKACGHQVETEDDDCLWLIRDGHDEITAVLRDFGGITRRVGPMKLYSRLPFAVTVMSHETRGELHKIYNVETNRSESMIVAYHGKENPGTLLWSACLRKKCYTLARKGNELSLHDHEPDAYFLALASRFVDGKISTKNRKLSSIRVSPGAIAFTPLQDDKLRLAFRIGKQHYRIDTLTNRIPRLP